MSVTQQQINEILAQPDSEDKISALLMECCGKRDLDAVNVLVKHCRIIDARKAIEVAYENDDVELFKLLNPKAQFSNQSGLSNACKHGAINIIKHTHDTNNDQFKKNVARVFSDACSGCNQEVIDFMIEKGRSNILLWLPDGIRGACESGNHDAAKYLFDKFGSLTLPKAHPSTLEFACRSKNKDLVSLLIKEGAKGIMAAYKPEKVELLLEQYKFYDLIPTWNEQVAANRKPGPENPIVKNEREHGIDFMDFDGHEPNNELNNSLNEAIKSLNVQEWDTLKWGILSLQDFIGNINKITQAINEDPETAKAEYISEYENNNMNSIRDEIKATLDLQFKMQFAKLYNIGKSLNGKSFYNYLDKHVEPAMNTAINNHLEALSKLMQAPDHSKSGGKPVAEVQRRQRASASGSRADELKQLAQARSRASASGDRFQQAKKLAEQRKKPKT